ncbi:Speckle-type POZ protein, partial [Araneus ventricosus]
MNAQASKYSQRKAHFTFIWSIENGSALIVSEYLKSPRFIAHSMEKTKWRLMMYKRFYGKSIHLGIQREENHGPDSIEIEFELSILDANGSPLGNSTFQKEFTDTDYECWLCIFHDREQVFFQRRAEFLPNDTFTVRCRMWRLGTGISKSETCFARTRLGLDRRSFVWEIKEFSSLQSEQKRTHCLYPPSSGSPQLILYLFLSEKNGKNYVNIQIDQNSAVRSHYILCKCSLLDSEGRVVHSKEIQNIILMNQPEVYTFQEFFEKDKLLNDESSLLQNDILYLKCEFQIKAEPAWNRIDSYGFSTLEDMERTTSETIGMRIRKPDDTFDACCPFKNAFEDLFENKRLSDVCLRTGARSFPAHKMVLSVRSPVFEAMFTQDMREKTSRIVEIPDLDVDTLSRLLLYIYKDTVEELQWESAMGLFRAADKYQI